MHVQLKWETKRSDTCYKSEFWNIKAKNYGSNTVIIFIIVGVFKTGAQKSEYIVFSSVSNFLPPANMTKKKKK